MSKKKHNTDGENESLENSDIVISDKTDITPAKEEKPDQSILNKPAHPKGITLKESKRHKIH